MRNEYLPFEQCLKRLSHSFIQTGQGLIPAGHVFSWGNFIDFQHPSIRDMLLYILQDEPKVRPWFISLASPEGLSSIIRGIPLFGSTHKDETHVLILSNEDELNLLCDRIKVVLTESITFSQVEMILSNADFLIPRKTDKKLGPADLDLAEFSKSPCGRVLSTILSACACQEAYETKTAYNLSSWTDILRKFYELAPYVTPVLHPTYLGQLVNRSESADFSETIRFFSCLSINEPLIFRQTFGAKLDSRLNSLVVSGLRERCQQGKNHQRTIYEDYEDERGAYETWRDGAKQNLEIAHIYYTFSAFSEPEELLELEELIDSVFSPEAPREDWEEEQEREPEEYWTIERLFEDL